MSSILPALAQRSADTNFGALHPSLFAAVTKTVTITAVGHEFRAGSYGYGLWPAASIPTYLAIRSARVLGRLAV